MRRGTSHAFNHFFIWLLSAIFYTAASRGESAPGSWDQEFSLPPGLNGAVNAQVVQGGNLYVGGAFSKAGGVLASGIACWNGTNWSALGGGVAGRVYALAMSGTNLYVGGSFYSAGGIPATNIARWDGTAWHALGGGVDQDGIYQPRVNALYTDGTNLYVGGMFIQADGLPTTNIARWDGSAWHDMASGVLLSYDYNLSSGGSVNAITGDGTNVYVGGMFVQAGDVAATNLVRWDGSAWHAFGDCTDGMEEYTYDATLGSGVVWALTVQSGKLYVGGDFGKVGDLAARNLAQWDGTNWQNVGDVQGGRIQALESYSGSLYVGGSFTNAGGVTTSNLSILTNGTWLALNAELNNSDSISSLLHDGEQLCVGGSFSLFNHVSAGNLAGQSGGSWTPFGSGAGNSVGGSSSALSTDGTNVYVCGYFGVAGTNPASSLAKWDGTNWSAVGLLPAADGPVIGTSVTVSGSNVFFDGYYTLMQDNTGDLAFWNGTSWNSPGGAVYQASVSQLLAVGNLVYAAGFFQDDSTNQFGFLSVWDGTRWTNLRPGDGFDSEDHLASDGTNVYTGHSSVDSDYNTDVEKWDGTSLVQIGDRIPSFRASAVAVNGTNLYLAGTVTTNNNLPVIYSWDGVAWQPIPTAFQAYDYVSSLLVSRGNLFAAGSFSFINGLAANSIAEWTGSNWLTLDAGVYGDAAGLTAGTVAGMVAIGTKLYLAGTFVAAGGYDSGNFAVWNESPQISLKNPRLQPGGGFVFDLHGQPGDQLEIQTSASLSSWNTLAAVTLTNAIQPFAVPATTNFTNSFYRARFVK